MSEPERILLTGAAGFVGRYLRVALARRFPHAERFAVVLAADSGPMENWRVIPCDLGDEARVDELVRDAKPDFIVHLAALSSVVQAAGAAEQTWRANFGGTFNLASAAASSDARTAFLYVSTSEVYGDSFLAGPAGEETPLAPRNVYARTEGGRPRPCWQTCWRPISHW